jgi:hypothetical protein
MEYIVFETGRLLCDLSTNGSDIQCVSEDPSEVTAERIEEWKRNQLGKPVKGLKIHEDGFHCNLCSTIKRKQAISAQVRKEHYIQDLSNHLCVSEDPS